MTLYGSKEQTAPIKDDVLKAFSDITGKTFVYDSLKDHVTKEGTVDTVLSDLFFHVVDPLTNKILSAEEAKSVVDRYADRLVDLRKNYKIISIEASQQAEVAEDESTKTIYVLAAVIALLCLIMIIIIYMFCNSTSRYKRKMKVLEIKDHEMNDIKSEGTIVPGSNVYSKVANPLLNADVKEPLPEADVQSHDSDDSLDENAVDGPKPPVYDELEEREVVLDMYTEDTFQPPTLEEQDALAAALRMHEEHTAAKNDRNKLLNSTDGGYGSANGHLNPIFNHLDLETSEI